MRIGYSKFGRSWNLEHEKGITGSGDVDVARGLLRLAAARPDDEFVLIGRNSGEDPASLGYPGNVINPWTEWRKKMRADLPSSAGVTERIDWYTENVVPSFLDCDHHIVWEGQHGTTNTPIPTVNDRSVVTNPQESFVNYCSYITLGINAWRDMDPKNNEDIRLCPDPRNYFKARDFKWPYLKPMIGQYELEKKCKHERFGDTLEPTDWSPEYEWDPKSNRNVWIATMSYMYGALELTALDEPDEILLNNTWENRLPFGMLVNENRAYVAQSRLDALERYVLPYWPDAEIFGKWTDKSLQALGRPDIRSCPYEYMPQTITRWRSTLSTPASGSGWATAKPWEAFAYGVVCFFHPRYDNKNFILRDADPSLAKWLRIESPDQLRKRVEHMDNDRDAWEWVIREQRKHFEKRFVEEAGGIRAILDRLN